MEQSPTLPRSVERQSATVAFIDLAGFSAITDVYGDATAIAMLELFEGLVGKALENNAPPIKWIGDEVMLSFPEPQTAIKALGALLPHVELILASTFDPNGVAPRIGASQGRRYLSDRP